MNADRSITFRYYAPSAQKVEIGLDYDPHTIPLQKGSDGIWTFKTRPLQPALHMYGSVVDGVHILDPLNTLVDPTFFFLSNQVRVPGSEPPTPSQSSALRLFLPSRTSLGLCGCCAHRKGWREGLLWTAPLCREAKSKLCPELVSDVECSAARPSLA